MTKKELFEKLKDLPDDTEIRVPEYDEEYTTSMVCVSNVWIDCDGSDGCQPEVSLY